jgi:hypothetical protein
MDRFVLKCLGQIVRQQDARSIENQGVDSCQCDVLSLVEGTVFETSATQITGCLDRH